MTRGGLAVLLETFTRLPLEAFGTRAVEVLVHAVALGLVLARVWVARVRRGPARDLTKLPSKLRWALTHEGVQHGMALATVLARPAFTLVPLDFTVSAHKTWRTLAVVTLQTLLARCSIQTLTVAVLHVDVTVLSGPSLKTAAEISTNQIFAKESVLTAISPRTLICIYLAGLSLPLWRAHTLEAVLQVDTGSTLSTRAGGTLMQIVGTGRTRPARRTPALEPRENLVARPAVGARVGNAGVLGYLTGLARVSRWTGAAVLVWFGVHAGSSVDARMVATAVVQIFIAQQAAPVPLAVALPRYVAGPVNAAGVKPTLITELALPAVATRAFSRGGAAAM